MVSEAMVEIAARAICKSRGKHPDECVFGSGFISRDKHGVVTSGSQCSRYAWQDHIGDSRAALEAALSSVQAPEWQPIETAPKDGTVISIKGDRGPYGVAAWEGHASWGTPVNWHRDSSTWLAPSDRPELKGAVLHLAGYVPTHWQPALPASPQPPAGKQ